MSRGCPTLKRNREDCSGTVPMGAYFCWAHDPAHRNARHRIASLAGKGNAKSSKTKLSKDLHALLEDFTQRVVDGDLQPYPASVAGSSLEYAFAYSNINVGFVSRTSSWNVSSR